MGHGIAQVAALVGYRVVLRDVEREFLMRGLRAIEDNLEKGIRRGKTTEAERDLVLQRIRGAVSLSETSDADLFIEAVPERMELKQETLREVEKIAEHDFIFASNTSSLSITEMLTATSLERQRRFIGLHFFNPVPIMKLVEVVKTILTDEAVYETAVDFGKRLGKVPVRASDKTGFIVNRLLVPYMLDSIRALEEGVGSIVDIDNAMKLGCGYPMGPLTLGDFVGLDTTYYIAEIMFNEFREKRFAPPPLLKRMVLAGLYGRKSGRGFYDYADPKNPVPMNLL
jgi:3-hydroxybutyryl-CoA dehydrogenase